MHPVHMKGFFARGKKWKEEQFYIFKAMTLRAFITNVVLKSLALQAR